MICLGTLNDRVRPDKPYYTNAELIEFSKTEGFSVPEDYKYMPVTVEFLVNDNVKWHTPHLFEPELYGWNLVVDHFIHEKTTKWANCKPLSYEAAKQRAEKKSSAGYIYKKKFRCNNKGEVFAKYDSHLKEQIIAISNGEDVPMIWEHGPKCEMRPLDKFENPDLSKRKQRTFMIADTLHYVVGLMLYSEQNDVELTDWDDPNSWSAAGMSLFHGGWDTMARLLLQGGSRFKCKDVSAMEASVRLPFQDAIYRARNHNYSIRNYDVGEEWEKNLNYHNLAKWWLKVLLYAPTIDILGFVWMRFGMNPSGQLNTLLDNIHALTMVFSYCLTQQLVDPVLDIQDLKRLHSKVILKLMGDDSIYPVNELLADLEHHAKHIGFTMTDEIDGDVPLTEAKFCGFGWSYNFEHHQYQHRADYKKVLSRIYGYRKKNSWRYTLANLYASKMLLYGTPHYHTVVCLISYVLSHHSHDLASERHLESEIPYEALFTQDKSEDQIAQLIFGH